MPMRAAALAGRPGKQPDGSAKTREVKLCTVWSAEGRDAIGTRLKRAGMHWTLAGANAIIALRCCKLSGRFADSREVRTQRRATG